MACFYWYWWQLLKSNKNFKGDFFEVDLVTTLGVIDTL